MIPETLAASERQLSRAHRDMRKVSNWRTESRTQAAVASGQLWAFRKCGKCGHRDMFVGECHFNGATPSGASCDFWSEGAI
jgi:hypothetical protein